MSDFKKVIKLLKNLKIGFEIEDYKKDHNRIFLTIKDHNTNVDAYTGFFSSFVFDSKEKFITLTIAEE